MNRGALYVVAAALGVVVGCSSLEPVPDSLGCASDEECTVEGEVCVNGRCVAGDAPPRGLIAFEIQERAAGATPLFRSQLRGCDLLVGNVENEQSLLVKRREVVQTFEFQVHAHPDVDPAMLVPDDLLRSRIEVTQSDRLSRVENPVRRGVDHAVDMFDMDGDPTEEVASFLPWPRYHPLDPGQPPAHVVWETRPSSEDETLPPLPPVFRMFRPFQFDAAAPCSQNSDCCEGEDCNPFPNYCSISPGQTEGNCSFIGDPNFIQTYFYDQSCARSIAGDVVSLGNGIASLAEAGVRFRYADPEDGPPLAVFDSNNIPLAERPAMCQDDADCGHDDLACDVDSAQCVLRLAGRTADPGASTSDDMGDFRTQVYTYCESSDPSMELERSYTVTVSPPGPRPSVTYDLTATFAPGSAQAPTFNLPGQLCVPEWGRDAAIAAPVELTLTGSARGLVAGGGAPLRCCDVGCLPATADDVDDTVMGPEACDGRTSGGVPPVIRLETPFSLSDEERQTWTDAGCLEPIEGTAGRLTAAVDCSGAGACTLSSLAWGDTEPRPYTLRVESPVGSVLASRILTVEIPPLPAAADTPLVLDPVELGGRVLVRGTVTVDGETCSARDDPSDCTSRGAIVIAERLAMPEVGGRAAETNTNVPGPYFHHVSTFFDPVMGTDGAFVLPLDPGGVYVVTALPTASEDGGPAPYTIVDLRDATEHTEDLVLADGLLVTLSLPSFDRRSVVVPLDTGTERTLTHPGRFEAGEADPSLNLSRVGECLSPANEPARGCRIRRLTPPNANLTLSQVGITRFKARAPGPGQTAGCGG